MTYLPLHNYSPCTGEEEEDDEASERVKSIGNSCGDHFFASVGNQID